jgi:hypothetical protein
VKRNKKKTSIQSRWKKVDLLWWLQMKKGAKKEEEQME